MAMKKGVTTAPLWAMHIEMCKTFPVKPWEFFGGSELLWYIRYKIFYATQASARSD